MVSDLWFRVYGFGLVVSGLWFRVYGFGFTVSSLRFRIYVFGLMVSGLRFRVDSFGLNLCCAVRGARVPLGRLANRRPHLEIGVQQKSGVN